MQERQKKKRKKVKIDRIYTDKKEKITVVEVLIEQKGGVSAKRIVKEKIKRRKEKERKDTPIGHQRNQTDIRDYVVTEKKE